MAAVIIMLFMILVGIANGAFGLIGLLELFKRADEFSTNNFLFASFVLGDIVLLGIIMVAMALWIYKSRWR